MLPAGFSKLTGAAKPADELDDGTPDVRGSSGLICILPRAGLAPMNGKRARQIDFAGAGKTGRGSTRMASLPAPRSESRTCS
jgi:hypothetical protein